MARFYKHANPAGLNVVKIHRLANCLTTVATKNLRDRIEIRIRDNGNGIPPDIREKIFNPFFTTKPTGQGTGLSISHDIIGPPRRNRGEIEVETEEGRFTEFVVKLPKV
ncbi:MAG: ATP-binding protein [candidate division KSB1 bacterium]|nr:ATP-binding protein [candidate division KSB1 bacterium]MDZ7364506.1 ATP-binding protein [candidate division KSB1 bacterium]MDZ7402877.1 ATP-binding protein [candidate division KSB1 bacterium]